MGGEWSGRDGEEKNSQILPGRELPIIQPVAQRYTTELFRLRFEELFNNLMLHCLSWVAGSYLWILECIFRVHYSTFQKT
jgi:hypothetical protein